VVFRNASSTAKKNSWATNEIRVLLTLHHFLNSLSSYSSIHDRHHHHISFRSSVSNMLENLYHLRLSMLFLFPRVDAIWREGRGTLDDEKGDQNDDDQGETRFDILVLRRSRATRPSCGLQLKSATGTAARGNNRQCEGGGGGGGDNGWEGGGYIRCSGWSLGCC